jgi:MFS family permease
MSNCGPNGRMPAGWMREVARIRQDMNMPQMDSRGRSTAGRAVGTTVKGARVAARGGSRAGRWAIRNVAFMRKRSGAGEIGMMRLLDLHAASCAGDTLVTMGLATTVFFQAPVGEARSRVALYLFITMVPFAILAPIVGPVLDRFRHGRRYALAVTMLGRAFLAWAISDYLHNFGLFPAAFGVLALSRAYGVARSAAVPRLLPDGLGLSEAGARASVFGTLAGAVIAPIGVIAIKIGPQWPLRLAAVVFIAGAVVALRLPPRADSDPPEVPPRIFQWPGRRPTRVLSGPLILGVLSSAVVLRAAYGFLVLFLAFSIRSHDLTRSLFGHTLPDTWALAIAIGALGAGSFLATAVGSRLRIRRPLLMQAIGFVVVAGTGVLACIWYSLGTVIVASLAIAIVGGLAKLAVDASIQERVAEDVRASAFAHSETLLMLAFVVGGAIGLIPFNGRLGIIVCTAGMVVAAIYAWLRAINLRGERLTGSAQSGSTPTGSAPSGSAAAQPAGPHPTTAQTTTAQTTTAQTTTAQTTTAQTTPPSGSARTVELPGGMTYQQGHYVHGEPSAPPGSWWARRRAAKAARTAGARQSPGAPAAGTQSTAAQPTVPQPTVAQPSASQPGRTTPGTTRVLPRTDDDQPGYHLYRPDSVRADDDSPDT